jgi:hypothetical protein
MSTADETKDSSHLPLLGLTVPLNSLSKEFIETDYDTRIRHRKRIPNALSDWWALPLSFRERHMINLMSQLTDEPDWKQKIQDEEIVKKWKKESVERWQDEPVEKQFSEKMFDYVRDQVFCVRSTELIVLSVLKNCWIMQNSRKSMVTFRRSRQKPSFSNPIPSYLLSSRRNFGQRFYLSNRYLTAKKIGIQTRVERSWT